MSESCRTHGKIRNAHKILVPAPQYKTPLGKTRLIIPKTNLGESRCETVDWILLSQDRALIGFCNHDNEPSGSMKGGEFID